MPENPMPDRPMPNQPISIREFPLDACRRLTALLCDLDDTVTTNGKVTPGAYEALWRAHEAGLAVVVVSGRPAGWADLLARLWPVHGVIAENGGLYFRHDNGRMHRYFAYSREERAGFRTRLERIGAEILNSVPGAAIAADQPYREFDLAIDFAEDVGPLPLDAARRIRDIFLSHGATATISSIHVNGWFGSFDKLAAVRRYLRDELAIDPETSRERIVFVGDSPNDAPLFSWFPHTVGVAAIRRFADLLSAWPAYVTDGDGGAGFAEAVDVILEKRGRGGSDGPGGGR